MINRSGAITVGNTAQALMVANNRRNGFFVQNISAGDLWINEQGTATLAQPSIKIPTGVTFYSPQNCDCYEAISIIGATTAQAFVAREW